MNIFQDLSAPSVWAPTAICVLAFTAYQHYRNAYTYWERRNVKGMKPLVPILPELWSISTKNRLNLALDRTKKFGCKVYGSFFLGRPQLVVADPELIRTITIKDFDSFQDHQANEWHNKYQRNFLLWLKGEHWRRVRSLMTPTFTSGKIKRMLRLLDACAQDLVDNFREQVARVDASGSRQPKAIVDLYEIFGMYTMDGITSCCYGIKLKREESIEKTSSRNAFERDANALFRFNFGRFILLSLTPRFITSYLNVCLTPATQMDPLAERVERLVEMRRQGVGHKYDDLLELLLDARLDDELELGAMDTKENHHASLTSESLVQDHDKLKNSLATQNDQQVAKSSLKLSHTEIIAESMFLLAAGLDTTRSSLSSACYFLAHNPEAQERLYRELVKIAKVNESGRGFDFEYDALTSCDYLDAVISETLRIFGPVHMIDREATRDYHIEKYDIDLKKGARLLLALHAVQNDPDYWDEPEQFNPDRFMPGQREKIVPGSYVPFSLGPRHCIGMRFSLTESKLALAKVITQFKLEPAPDTKYPPEPNFSIGLVNIKDCRVSVSLRSQ